MEDNMTNRQRMHKKLIKMQNRTGKIEGKAIWKAMKKDLVNGTSP
jgi:hypothetical protein